MVDKPKRKVKIKRSAILKLRNANKVNIYMLTRIVNYLYYSHKPKTKKEIKTHCNFRHDRTDEAIHWLRRHGLIERASNPAEANVGLYSLSNHHKEFLMNQKSNLGGANRR